MKYPCKSMYKYNIVTIDRRETIKIYYEYYTYIV